jgi:hypothetical protein
MTGGRGHLQSTRGCQRSQMWLKKKSPLIASSAFGLSCAQFSSRALMAQSDTRHYIKDVPKNTQNGMNFLEALCNGCAPSDTTRLN